MTIQQPQIPMPCIVVRSYAAFHDPNSRKVLGDSLAPALIKEALRLLCAEYRQDVQAAYEAMDLIASQSAQSLLDEKAAGKKPGLVVRSHADGEPSHSARHESQSSMTE